MNHTNIVTVNIQADAEFQLIDQMINLETKRRLLLVPEAKDYNVWTACYIDGEFKVVSEYEIDMELLNQLEAV